MDTRSLYLTQIGDTSHWGRDVQRWEVSYPSINFLGL